MLYELLIRFDSDGAFQGAHAIDWNGAVPGDARPIKAEDWPDVAASVNTATFDALAAASQKADALAAVKAAILDDKLDDAATVEAARAAVEGSELPEVQKKIAELQARKAEIDAEIAELSKTP